MATGGYEHAYDPGLWSSLTDKANCYAYSLNIYTSAGHKLQPGEKAGSTFTSLTKSSIVNAVGYDMPYLNKTFRASSYSEKPGYREYKVALVIAPNADYHWYRQDADGGWSHKRGLTAITFRDAYNYSTWCGYYIVKY